MRHVDGPRGAMAISSILVPLGREGVGAGMLGSHGGEAQILRVGTEWFGFSRRYNLLLHRSTASWLASALHVSRVVGGRSQEEGTVGIR